MTYEAFEDKTEPGQWRVEAIDHDSEGECYVTIFSGRGCERRAREYADWMNSEGLFWFGVSALLASSGIFLASLGALIYAFSS